MWPTICETRLSLPSKVTASSTARFFFFVFFWQIFKIFTFGSFSETIFRTGDHKFVSKSVAQLLCILNKVRTNLVKRCGDSNHGNRLITNGGKNIKIIKNIEIKKMVVILYILSIKCWKCYLMLPICCQGFTSSSECWQQLLFVCYLFVICLLVVCYLFVICLFVICLLFVCLLLFVSRGLLHLPNVGNNGTCFLLHPPWCPNNPDVHKWENVQK